ncbi:MAG: DoxX family protein, partial [Calditrichaeota bacterium]
MNFKRLILTLLRAAIGWHFLYEGLAKILQGNWSSAGYLANTHGFLSGLYHWLTRSETLLRAVDLLNMYGLLFIGLALFLGLFTRWAAGAGALLLVLYYFAYPPFGNPIMGATESHLFIVDKIMIEALVLIFLFIFPQKGYGIDALFHSSVKVTAPSVHEPAPSSRREALKNLATLPALGVMGWGALHARGNYDVDATTGATIQIGQKALGELKGELPKG